MAKFKTIDIDADGYKHIVKPIGCIDFHSDEREADFIDKNEKILLRIKSIHKGWANELAREIFNNSDLQGFVRYSFDHY